MDDQEQCGRIKRKKEKEGERKSIRQLCAQIMDINVLFGVAEKEMQHKGN